MICLSIGFWGGRGMRGVWYKVERGMGKVAKMR